MTDKRRFHKKSKPDGYKPPFPDAVLAEPITNLTLREETSSLLLGANVTTVGDVLRRCETDFYKICKFNKKNLLDVKAAVKKRNLFLKPAPVKDDAPSPNPSETSDAQNRRPQPAPIGKPQQNQNGKPQNQNKQRQDKNGKRIQPNDQRGVKPKAKETPYVMTTLPEKPPRPVKVAIKEEPDAYVKINKNGLWGFRDRNSKDMAVPAVYDEVFSFKEDLCCVQKEEKFGFINREGEEIIPIVYDCATSFSEGLACVYKGEHCGYINKQGETVVDFKFDAGTPVVNGECRVKKNGKWGEMHLDNPEEIRWII